MIRALELENFKAFGKRSRIQFAAITLIYGQNSAGKSSVLNALNLLKQTRQSRDQGALLLPRAESGLVDLGSFHELLHDHDLSRTLMIRIDLRAARSRRRFSRDADEEPEQIGFEVGFRRENDGSDVSLAFMQAHAVGVDSQQPIFRFEPAEIGEAEQREMLRYFLPYATWRRNRRIFPRELKAVKCVAITSSPEFWSVAYHEAREAAAEIVRALEMLRDEMFREPTRPKHFSDADLHEDDFATAIAFYRSSFTLEDFISRRRKADLDRVAAVDGFLPMPARSDSNISYPEVHALRVTGELPMARLRVFDAVESIIYAGRMLELELERLFPLGPYRRAPERLYIFTGTTPRDVGYSGKLLPDLLFRRPALVRETNQWLDRLEIGYHIQISPVGTPSNDLFEVRLLDRRRSASTSIALPDVGFGISQILPLIVQTLASEEQTITIEQPEVHIHPKLQADLADLLVAGIQPDRNHRFVVETHSEHLILRLLRRIRETSEGTLPDGQPALTADDLSVVYLQRGAEGTDVHHIRVDQSGELIDHWPQGFFAERMKELL